MNSKITLGLCCGSLIQSDFRGLAEAASKAGFESISMWPTLYQAALDNGLSEQDLRVILDDNGLIITELDPVSSWLPTAVGDGELAAAFHAFPEDYYYRMAEVIGGRTLNVIQLAGHEFTVQQRAELLNPLCDRAAAHDLRVSIEFFPWGPIGSLNQALELVAAVDHPNCGINLDTWHHFRSGGTLEDIRCLEGDALSAFQFNGVALDPWDDVIAETMGGRQLPHESGVDMAPVLKALLETATDPLVNVEIFSRDMMALPAEEAAQQMYASTRAVLERFD